VTFKNAVRPKEVLARVPMDRLLIETDCPYLTPHPHRGKRNEPSYVRFVAEAGAEIKGMEVREFIEITGQNAIKLLGIR
jgi:TatD DNase family protein